MMQHSEIKDAVRPFCSGILKAEYMHEVEQEVHVWIDDRPELIGESPERRAVRTMFDSTLRRS